MEKFLPTSFRNLSLHDKCIRSEIKSEEDLRQWVEEYSLLSKTNWNVKKCIRSNRFVVRMIYLCHHTNYKRVDPKSNKRGRSKNCSCPAEMHIKIKCTTKDTIKKDPYVKDGLPGQIDFKHEHNHSETSESFSYLRPSRNIKEIFEAYFNDGLGVKESINLHESKLELEEGENSVTIACASMNPPKHTVYDWYRKWRTFHLGPRTGPGIIEVLQQKHNIYKEQGIIVEIQEEPFAIVIITPIMQRAHNLPFAKDIAFMDSTSSCDSESHTVTFLLTFSHIGAVPLAVIITKGQRTEDYVAGCSLLKRVMPTAFCSQQYPKVIITDDSESERQAIALVWPDSKALLCRFHVCQSVWRWLCDKNNDIIKEHRQILYRLFRDVLTAATESSAFEAYCLCIGETGAQEFNVVVSRYPKWKTYISNYWKRRKDWSLAFRSSLTHGHQTNNFSEVNVRLFKDIVLLRNKAYNAVSLVDFVCTGMETYYKRRLRDYSNNRQVRTALLLRSQLLKCSYLKKEDIKVEANCYKVPSESNPEIMYEVQVALGFCSCEMGRLGKFCKHQAGVYNHFQENFPNSPAITAESKYLMATLAFGEENVMPLTFYKSLRTTETPSTSALESTLITDNQRSADIESQSTSTMLNLEENNNDSSQTEFTEFINLLQSYHNTHGSSSKIIYLCMQRLKKISTRTAWDSYLATAGSYLPRKHTSKSVIRVQPTTISRRKTLIQGTKRLAGGRPSKESLKRRKIKRPRNLQLNVDHNVPNAIGH